MAIAINKTQTQRGTPIALYGIAATSAAKICDSNTATSSDSITSSMRIGIGNFKFSIPSNATISKIIFSTIASSEKGNGYIRRYICAGLTSSDTNDPPGTQLVNTYLFNTNNTVSTPTTYRAEYTAAEFQNLISSAGLSTKAIDFINNDVDIYFVAAKTLFKSCKMYIYDNSITVNYTVPGYTITVKTSGGGTATGGGNYESGATATLKATPNSGYRFVKWSDGNTSATRTITVTKDVTYTAIFEIKQYTVPQIDSAALTYNGAKISSTNKVPAGQSFLLSVGVSEVYA